MIIFCFVLILLILTNVIHMYRIIETLIHVFPSVCYCLSSTAKCACCFWVFFDKLFIINKLFEFSFLIFLVKFFELSFWAVFYFLAFCLFPFVFYFYFDFFASIEKELTAFPFPPKNETG